jgi:peptide deformylase
MAIGRKGYSDLHVLVNPKVVWRSRAQVERAEGCVNFPTTWGETVRPRSVQVAAWDRSGNEITVKVTGWPAIMLQHEIDHLEGRLFIDRLTDPRRAHLVAPEEFAAYRRSKPGEWSKFVDVSSKVVQVKE